MLWFASALDKLPEPAKISSAYLPGNAFTAGSCITQAGPAVAEERPGRAGSSRVRAGPLGGEGGGVGRPRGGGGGDASEIETPYS